MVERLKHIQGLSYYSFDRGRFLSWEEARPTVEFYRNASFLRQVQYVRSYRHAVETVADNMEISISEAETRFAAYLTRVRSLKDEGREELSGRLYESILR